MNVKGLMVNPNLQYDELSCIVQNDILMYRTETDDELVSFKKRMMQKASRYVALEWATQTERADAFRSIRTSIQSVYEETLKQVGKSPATVFEEAKLQTDDVPNRWLYKTLHTPSENLSQHKPLADLFSVHPVDTLWHTEQTRQHWGSSEDIALIVDASITAHCVYLDEAEMHELCKQEHEGEKVTFIGNSGGDADFYYCVKPGNDILHCVLEQCVEEPKTSVSGKKETDVKLADWLQGRPKWQTLVREGKKKKWGDEPFIDKSLGTWFYGDPVLEMVERVSKELLSLGLPSDEGVAFYTWQKMCPWANESDMVKPRRRLIVRTYVLRHIDSNAFYTVEVIPAMYTQLRWTECLTAIDKVFNQHREAFKQWSGQQDIAIKYRETNAGGRLQEDRQTNVDAEIAGQITHEKHCELELGIRVKEYQIEVATGKLSKTYTDPTVIKEAVALRIKRAKKRITAA